MNELLDEVLTAHGGTQRWQSVSAITARGRLGGLLPTRFPGNKLANFTVAVHVAEQHTVLHGFPQAGKRAVFDRGDVRIETRDGEQLDTRTDPRSAFFGLSGTRRNVHWDPLDRWAVSLAYLTDILFDRSVVSIGLSSQEDAQFAASEGIPMPKTS
jgi:hypothetical protein